MSKDWINKQRRARVRYKMSDIYTENGYADRRDYLNNLAESNDVSTDVVYELADVLGESEDFDGLVVAVQDFAENEGW